MSNFVCIDAQVLASERQELKRSWEAPLRENAVWVPVGMQWFTKWKLFVDFDEVYNSTRSQEILNSLHPGEMDNNSLQGMFGDELRRNIIEGRDFVLIPHSLYKSHFARYGGGPLFPRKVVNVRGYRSNSTELRVCLHPVRIEMSICNHENPIPLRLGDHFLQRYFSARLSLQEAAIDMCTAAKCLGLLPSTGLPTRVWLRDSHCTVHSGVTDHRLTCNAVDRDGEWTFARKEVLERVVHDIRGDHDCVEIILEVATKAKPNPEDWPRHMLLEGWKRHLRIGDEVDYKVNASCYRVATVLGVERSGQVIVCSHHNDEVCIHTVDVSDISERIQPLHAFTDKNTRWSLTPNTNERVIHMSVVN